MGTRAVGRALIVSADLDRDSRDGCRDVPVHVPARGCVLVVCSGSRSASDSDKPPTPLSRFHQQLDLCRVRPGFELTDVAVSLVPLLALVGRPVGTFIDVDAL